MSSDRSTKLELITYYCKITWYLRDVGVGGLLQTNELFIYPRSPPTCSCLKEFKLT